MPAERFVEQLNIQIGNEFAAHQQYVACAVYYDALTMPQTAGFFYAQALEERGHAMMMVKYLVDQDAPVRIPGVASPEVDFNDLVAPVELALEQERRVTVQINELTKIAREESDFASDQFMQWFIKEQVEEVATMSDLVAVVRRSKDNIEAIEDYIQREQSVRPTTRRCRPSPAAERRAAQPASKAIGFPYPGVADRDTRAPLIWASARAIALVRRDLATSQILGYLLD